MIFKSNNIGSIAILPFLLPVVFLCCLFLKTSCAQTFPGVQPVKEYQENSSVESNRGDQNPTLWEDQKWRIIIGFVAMFVLQFLLIVGFLVQKRQRKTAEKKLQEYVRNLEPERCEKEREKIETQLQQAGQKQAMAALAGGMIHDVNNVLSSVLGFAEFVKIGLSSGENVEKDLDEALKAAMKARTLVSQIETFIRQAGIQKMPIEVTLLIKEAIKFIRALLPASIEISFRPGAFKGIILADPVQFHKILIILCANALHAMKGNAGMLEIRLQDMSLDDKRFPKDVGIKPGQYFQLSIGDTGDGMTKEPPIERTFDPCGTPASIEVYSPGFSLVQSIAREMDGTISVCNEPEKGTIFYGFFPKYEKRSDQESNG
jgi:signal transduction histidine kinase